MFIFLSNYPFITLGMELDVLLVWKGQNTMPTRGCGTLVKYMRLPLFKYFCHTDTLWQNNISKAAQMPVTQHKHNGEILSSGMQTWLQTDPGDFCGRGTTSAWSCKILVLLKTKLLFDWSIQNGSQPFLHSYVVLCSMYSKHLKPTFLTSLPSINSSMIRTVNSPTRGNFFCCSLKGKNPTGI